METIPVSYTHLKHFSVDTYEIRSEKIHEGERTFVFLSDLHDNRFGAGQKDLLEARCV